MLVWLQWGRLPVIDVSAHREDESIRIANRLPATSIAAPARRGLLRRVGPMVAGGALAIMMVAGVWFGIGALWTALAGSPPENLAPHWQGISFGLGAIGSTAAFTRIERASQNIARIDLTSSPRATVTGIFLLLEYLTVLLMGLMFGN
jgi:hypothetical protein